MVAQLVGEPFNVQRSELPHLTLRMIASKYFHKRDENGSLAHPGAEKPDQTEMSDIFRIVWSSRGATPKQVEELWEEHLKFEAAKFDVAFKDGVISITGQVYDMERWAAIEVEMMAEWEETAKRVLGHGE